MSDKLKFNAAEWLNNSEPVEQPKQNLLYSTDLQTKVENIIIQIESKQVDICPDYKDWLACGFALADSLNESGRDYFHRISKFFPNYNYTECDNQFNNCLKAKGSGVTIASFFRCAQNAGVYIPTDKQQSQIDTSNTDFIETPVIPSTVYQNLPDILQKVCNLFSTDRERDIVLLGSIVTISSCIPNVYGIYKGSKVYSNLFLFIAAQASGGKGILKHCKRLVYPIHKMLRDIASKEKAQYEVELAEYNSNKNKALNLVKPIKPKEKLLFIPANSSASGALQLLFENDGRGLIFETEGDTLADIFKTDFGNYSDSLRKAFHHETISFFRRTNSEYVDIENPCLSTVLSGTPKQISNLIPDAENGLFSRFMFYQFPMVNIWLNVFEVTNSKGFDCLFDVQAQRLFELYKTLITCQPIEFRYSINQVQEFNIYFSNHQTDIIQFFGTEAVANIRRLGIIFFRFSMIITILRVIDTGEFPATFICSDNDFNTTLQICNVLLEHSKAIFLQLATQPKQIKQPAMKDKFYEILPEEFSRKEAVVLAEKIRIKPRTVDKYLKSFKGTLLTQDGEFGKYKKCEMQSMQSIQSMQSK